jgi:hypothetical protein
MRRAEDKIRKLGADLCASKDEGQPRQVLAELRISLHEYVDHLRAHLAAYPYVVERRVRHDDERRIA